MSCLAGGLGLPAAILAYALFTLVAIVGPGLAVLRLLRVPVDPAAVLPLGLASCAGTYWLSLAAGRPDLFPGFVAALNLCLLLPRGPWRRAPGPSLRGALWPVAGLLVVFSLTQFPHNRCAADGSFLFDPLERIDTAFHVAASWELTHDYPPQVPGLAGVPLEYHYGPHLVRAAAQRWAGVHPYDALTRFDLTLWAVALVLALRAGAAVLGLRPWLVDLAPWTLLAADASFIFAGSARDGWWTELLGGNLLLSLFFANAAVPALAMAVAALASTARAERGEGRGFWVVTAVLGLALPYFKVFLAAQFLGALLVVAALGRRRRACLLAAGPGLVALALLALESGGGMVQVSVNPLGAVQEARTRMGWDVASGWTLALWAPVWIVTSLGLRVAAVAPLLRALRSPSVATTALALMALSGWPLRLALHVTADGVFNEAVYFTVHSGALLWLFALPALAVLARAVRAPLLVGLAVGALCLPTTGEFLWRRVWSPPDVIPASVVRAMNVLAELTLPGEVVLQPSFSRYPPAPVVLIGRRVAYAEYLPYLEQFAPRALLAGRLRSVRRFFKTRDPDEARSLAARTGARYVCVFGRAPRAEIGELLEPVYADEGVALFRLRLGPSGDRAGLPLASPW